MKKVLSVCLILFMLLLLTGCNGKQYIDYGDAESFEAALNSGENLEGKIVCFKAIELHPDSLWGYNVWSGEHLNFVSSKNPNIKEGDVVTVKCKSIDNVLGSWIISYEKVSNAEIGVNTVFNSVSKDLNNSSSNSNDNKSVNEATNKEKTTNAAAEDNNDTYTNNQYFDVVEKGSFTNYGHTTIIHKVLAKKNAAIDASIIAYSSDGTVIGKGTSDIELTEGEYNYFEYYFDVDVSEATFEEKYNTIKSSNTAGERKAVEMVDYNVSGDDLLVTFKQTGASMGSFAKFKLLLYSGDEIVGEENGYFSIYAKNLNGKDSTDVAKLWVYGKEFDRVEFFYEP